MAILEVARRKISVFYLQACTVNYKILNYNEFLPLSWSNPFRLYLMEQIIGVRGRSNV